MIHNVFKNFNNLYKLIKKIKVYKIYFYIFLQEGNKYTQISYKLLIFIIITINNNKI